MDLMINREELEALCGLPHTQQLTYLRGIRPYMDIKTGLVGIKRRISYQSISEQLYIEPHQGIKSQSFSRDQVRRAVSGLKRAGIIDVQSEGMQLILKCSLATRHYSVQNKAAINPPQQPAINPSEKSLINTGLSGREIQEAAIVEPSKAAIPLKENNYIYLLSQFEKFWLLYPEKKSRERALKAFEQLSPDEYLFRSMLEALEQQMKARRAQEVAGAWVPPWKYPANWLTQKSWEDEIKIESKQEKRDAKRCAHTEKSAGADMFWSPEREETDAFEETGKQDNVIDLQCYRQS